MKRFLTIALTCLPLLCIGAPTYTTYFNNTHTYTNSTTAGTNSANRGVFTNGITAGASAFTGDVGFSDGTQASPSIYWTADADGSGTGFYRHAANRIGVVVGGTADILIAANLFVLKSAETFGWAAGAVSTTPDTILARDGAANTLALRNAANAQTFNIYNTYTDASNYERASLRWSGNVAILSASAAGTGSQRQLQIGDNTTGQTTTFFSTGGRRAFYNGNNWTFETPVVFSTDNTYDIGAAAATRPRFVHVARTTVSGVTSPAQITADQNNYNPGAQGKFIRLSTDASRTLTGLTFTTAQVDGEEHLIVNVGAQDLVLAHESGSSTAGNRFLSTTGASLTLTANQQAALWYDGTTARWRVSKNN